MTTKKPSAGDKATSRQPNVGSSLAARFPIGKHTCEWEANGKLVVLTGCARCSKPISLTDRSTRSWVYDGHKLSYELCPRCERVRSLCGETHIGQFNLLLYRRINRILEGVRDQWELALRVKPGRA